MIRVYCFSNVNTNKRVEYVSLVKKNKANHVPIRLFLFLKNKNKEMQQEGLHTKL